MVHQRDRPTPLNGLPYDSFGSPSLPGSQGGGIHGMCDLAMHTINCILIILLFREFPRRIRWRSDQHHSTEDLTIFGMLSSDGMDGIASGGGSGGTIFILTNAWSGNGSLTTNVGMGALSSGGGSGGRIAVHFQNSTFAGKITSFGG